MLDHLFMKNTAQAAAKKYGITKFDMYGASSDDANVNVKDGKADLVKSAERTSLLVRVWNKEGRVGVASSNDTSATGIETALQLAHEASQFGVLEHAPDFSPLATSPLASAALQKSPQPIFSPSQIEEMVNALCEAERFILASSPAIKGVPYNAVSQKSSSRFYLNSDGALRTEEKASAYAYLYTRTEEEGKRSRSAGKTVVGQSFSKLDLKECAKEAVDKTLSHLNYERIESGKYQVVFSASAFLDLLGAFSNAFDAQRVLDKQSLSKQEHLQTQIASDLFSLFDDPLHAQNFGATSFDSEGTPTSKLALIEDGILKTFLHSAGTAKRFGTKPTGHANIGSKVTVSPHFFHITRGAKPKMEKDLSKEELVVYVDEVSALHAGVNALEGAFSLPFDGWVYRNGKRVSIESATVAGDFFTLLKSICYVGDKTEVTPVGICPEIWVSELSIAGE